MATIESPGEAAIALPGAVDSTAASSAFWYGADDVR